MVNGFDLIFFEDCKTEFGLTSNTSKEAKVKSRKLIPRLQIYKTKLGSVCFRLNICKPKLVLLHFGLKTLKPTLVSNTLFK